jgi:O-antigen ligase
MMNPEKRKAIHQKIFLVLSMAIAFTIPVNKLLLPWLIVLLALNWLVEGEYIRTFPMVIKDKRRLFVFSFSFLYFLYLAGLLYTKNFQYALEDLEMKLSIFIFPLIFATSALPLFTTKQTGMVLRAFGAGCIAGSFIFLGRAFYYGVMLDEPGAFYYTSLAWNFHPSYFSMYLAFAVSNIICFLLIRQTVTGVAKVTFHIILLLFFSMMIVLLSSKAGLLIWGCVIFFYSILLIFRRKEWLKGFIFAAIAVTTFSLLLMAFPHALGRVSQAKQDMASVESAEKSGRSTGDRVLIWKASKEIVRQNFLFGVGTGDVRDKLMEEYQKSDAITAMKNYLNAHDQYMQTFIALGIPGLLLLVYMIVAPAVLCIKRANYIFFAFLFITGFNMFFESMFERQEGVVFFMFFSTLLLASFPGLQEPEEK